MIKRVLENKYPKQASTFQGPGDSLWTCRGLVPEVAYAIEPSLQILLIMTFKYIAVTLITIALILAAPVGLNTAFEPSKKAKLWAVALYSPMPIRLVNCIFTTKKGELYTAGWSGASHLVASFH